MGIRSLIKSFKKNKEVATNVVEEPKDKMFSPWKPVEIEAVNNYKYSAWSHDGVGEYYAKNVDIATFFDKVTKRYFLQYIDKGDKVLDVGAGTGRLSFAIAEQGNEVVAIDISADMLSQIDINKGELNINTVVGNCEKLPFDDNSFDKIVSLDAMIHFIQWDLFLKEQVRVVKPNGLVLFNIYCGENLNKYSTDKNERGRFSTNGDFVASVTNQELQDVCSSMENSDYKIEIVKQIPFNFLHVNSLGYGYVSPEELFQFSKLYYKMMKNPEFLNIITEFENTIVKNKPLGITSQEIVVLRKVQK